MTVAMLPSSPDTEAPMAIPNLPDHPDHPPGRRDLSQRAMSSKALPIVVLIVLLITVVATYYWYA